MLDFALISNGHGFKALVRMPAHAALFVPGGEFIRRRVIQHQEGAQFAAQAVIVEHGANREAVADPVHSGATVNALQFFHRLTFLSVHVFFHECSIAPRRRRLKCVVLRLSMHAAYALV